MYLSFFGLSERPFSLAPDPRFFFMGASHQEACAQIEERRGLVVLTGEAGTGKTSLLLALRERLDPEIAVTHVFNTTLPFDGMVEFMLEDLGIAKLEESPAMRLAALSGFLSEREQAGQSTTLIIDEAQNLEVPTLAQLGALANLDGTAPGKHLQILLVGPPELEARLEHPDLQHLCAAIGARCRLRPLDTAEVESYIRGRLRIAARTTRACSASGRYDESRSIRAALPGSSTRCATTRCSSDMPTTSAASTGTSSTTRSRT